MSIGTGIVLFVIGAVLTFALNVQVDWINVQLVGYILMGAGALVFVIGLVLVARKRQSVTTQRTSVDPASGESISERSTESDTI